MQRKLICCLAISAAVTLLAGCGIGFPSDAEFTSNDQAKELLGGQTLSDPAGNVQLQFDADGKLIDIGGNALPAELANVKINGDPFQVTVPDEVEYIGGKTFTVTLEPTKTVINDDGSVEIAFQGGAEEVAALVDHITLDISADSDLDQDGQVSLSNVELDLSATTTFFGITVPVFNEQFDDVLTLQL